MSDEPSKSDVEELCDKIEADNWDVSDFDFEGGMYDTFTATIKVEWQPPTPERLGKGKHTRRVSECVDELEAQNEKGAPIKQVVTEASGASLSEDHVRDILEQMRKRGDVYEPETDHLRVV